MGDDIDEMLTVAEAARELGISHAGVHRRLVRGDMRGRLMHGRLWLVSRAEVERWKERGKLSPGPKRRSPPTGEGEEDATAG